MFRVYTAPAQTCNCAVDAVALHSKFGKGYTSKLLASESWASGIDYAFTFGLSVPFQFVCLCACVEIRFVEAVACFAFRDLGVGYCLSGCTIGHGLRPAV